ncbi:hypothetical protein KEM54_001436 [Ascosphaera aggregata]|nr:hypothetical protein KEM54_001436 [Ascosphaera aggregata]
MAQQIEEIPTPLSLNELAYLYGHPLLNSLSPLLHKTIYNALGLNWEQFPLSRSDTASSQTDSPPYTLSPPIDDFLTHVRANDRTDGTKILAGTNTDCIGVKEAFLRNLPRGVTGNPFAVKPALIIGGGGTARAAMYTFRTWLDVSKIYIVNRDVGEVEAIMKQDAERQSPYHVGDKRAPIIHIKGPSEVQGLQPPVAMMSGIPNYPPKTAAELNARKTVEALFKSSSASSG